MLDILTIPIIPKMANYSYIIHNPDSDRCALVDPGEAGPLLDVIKQRGWTVDQIFITHADFDHVGGLSDILAAYNPKVIGSALAQKRCPEINHVVAEGDQLSYGGQPIEVLETPGHVNDHISFYLPGLPALFSGDALFSLGCGRIFDGPAPAMWHSLKKFLPLSDETLVYCGHEYTASNADFALTIDPENETLKTKAQTVSLQRASDLPTIPFDLGTEKAANPFLRCDKPEITQALGLAVGTPAEQVFVELRQRKDNF